VSDDFDVICVGAANFDTIAVVEHIPGDDERETTDQFVTAGGGPAATAAVALARLGARVAICAVIGNDPAGALVRDQLESEGVDTRWLRADPSAATPMAYVLASRATTARSIVTTVASSPSAREIPVDRSTWLHVDQTGFTATRAAMKRSTSRSRLSVDAGNAISALNLNGVDLYVPTVDALLARYPSAGLAQAIRAARSDGARNIVVTAGSSGTYVDTIEGLVHLDAYPVAVESTIGAGDVFHGSLLAGLAQGYGLVEASRWATAAAALSCTGLDGRSMIPNAAELEAFLAARLPRVEGACS
jgi:sulfofructose kinase